MCQRLNSITKSNFKIGLARPWNRLMISNLEAQIGDKTGPLFSSVITLRAVLGCQSEPRGDTTGCAVE